MAGGCEEVVAVGSWIGTGAGTSVELNKKREADGAVENIGSARLLKAKGGQARPLQSKQTVFG
jgi:hypothetical protein